MRNSKRHESNADTNGQATQVVQVKFSHSEATAVAIAGTFNDWRPEATPMVAMGEGQWRKELILPPGRYEYLFVADGKWIVDPLATETVPNPFGGVNSLLAVPDPQKRSVR